MSRFLLYLSVTLVFSLTLSAQSPEKPHILFIMIDDMNDFVEGFDGHPQAETPNIDSLAQLGTTFYNGYCNSVLCAPSRVSFMTGTYPESNGLLINTPYDQDTFRNNILSGIEVRTFPEVLKDSAGYFTVSAGKIFHLDDGNVDYDFDNPDICGRSLSWNKTFPPVLVNTTGSAGASNPQGTDEIKWSAIDSSLTDEMIDYIFVDSLTKFISSYANDPSEYCDRPVLMALGIRKPHSHLYIPEQYFKDYYIDDFYEEPYTINYNSPEGSYPYNGLVFPEQPNPPYSDYDSLPQLAKEQIALGSFNSFSRWFNDLPSLPTIDPDLTDEEREEILLASKDANGIMAYLAGIKFADDMIGRVMDTLRNYPEIYNNTIVVFSSDHGFAWGEKKHYGKSQLWDTDTRVPFIIADLRTPAKQRTTRPVSLIDIFPTLCEYAGIPVPLKPDGSSYIEGHSLVPLMENPNQQWEYPALTQIKNNVYGNACWPQNSVQNERFHLIQFRTNGAGETSECDYPNSETATLLYEVGADRDIDPNEWNNLAENPDYAPVIDYLKEFFPEGSLFAQKAFSVVINEKSPPCLYENTDKIKLRAQVFDSEGVRINDLDAAGYYVEWTNNINAFTFTGNIFQFNLNFLSAAEFENNEKIIFYAHVYETATGNLKGMNVHYSYINPSNRPNVIYNTVVDSTTLVIDGYMINGDYTSTYWNMGDGNTLNTLVPGPYTYASTGDYTIKNVVEYGNNCKRNFVTNISVDGLTPDLVERNSNNMFVMHPNPANSMVYIVLEKAVSNGRLNVYALDGSLVHSERFGEEINLSLNTSGISSGMYWVELNGTNFRQVMKLEIAR